MGDSHWLTNVIDLGVGDTIWCIDQCWSSMINSLSYPYLSVIFNWVLPFAIAAFFFLTYDWIRYELLISAKYHPDIGKILTMRGIPLEKGMPNFDLFISVVLLPEISIEMAKFQFNGSYKLAEQQYLKFSRLLVKVIYILFFILIYLMAATNLSHLCITLHCGFYTI